MDFEREFISNHKGLWIKYIPPYKIFIWAQRLAYSIPQINDLPIKDYSAFELAVFKYRDDKEWVQINNNEMISLGIDLSDWNYSANDGGSHGAYVPKSVIENVISILTKLQEDPVISLYMIY